MRSSAKRVLFIAEAVTLAHVARPYALARALGEDEWDISFAAAPHFDRLFPGLPWPRETIASVSPQQFMQRLAAGQRLYGLDTLRDYAREDLALLERLRPDAVIGDFRLSLSVSARIARIPYLTLSNAYWSPFAADRKVPVPCLPMTRILGVPLATALFTLSRPAAFAWHTIPLNRLRQEYGLPPLGPDLRRVYTDADQTLYADVPELVPIHQAPPHHRYIGPIEWSPPIPLPESLQRAESGARTIYVTMGSSGAGSVLPAILAALGKLDCEVVVATAGVPCPSPPANARIFDYLPGDLMAARASLVVCNGGSPTSHQALARGVPVLGLPFNLDQHLNMAHLAAYGAGISIRPEHASVAALRHAAAQLLDTETYRARAQELSGIFATYRPGERLAGCLRELTAGTK